jgi:predicted SAM-dependent methyltransferase
MPFEMLGAIRKIPVVESLAVAAGRRLNTFRRRRELARRVKGASPLRIVIGASGIAEADWIATEADQLDVTQERDWRRYFAPGSLDVIFAEHVWEHLTAEQGIAALRNCHRYLKPGGLLRLAVPDGFHPDPAYIEWVRVGGSGPGAADHKVLYNWQTLGEAFRCAGFHVRLLEYFDAGGQFHFTEWEPRDGLVRRSSRFDERNRDQPLAYTSLIVDGIKPDGPGTHEAEC